jgi:HK97 family phage major capsid protein
MRHERLPFTGIELKGEGDPPEDDANAIVTKALDELKSTVETRVGALETKAGDFEKITKRLDAIEIKVNRPGGGGTKSDDEAAAIEKKAFTTFLRKGREALGADEIKSLHVSDDTAGGYLAPAEFSAEVDKNIVQFSLVRQAARVGSTASGSVIVPRRTGRPTAAWVGETETRTETESTYGQVEIPIDEIACYVDVSNKLLEDAAVDVAAEVAFDLAEEFGRAEGEAFITGNGVKKPLGLLNDTGLSYTPSGSASAVTDSDGGANGLIDLFYALAPFYRQRGVWMANGTTIASLRKMKDSQKQYLWQPAVAAGQPETFLGRPIIEAVDLPDPNTGTFPILFGDFASAFRIYDRIALSLLRDPYSQATSGLTRFHARRRVGARVVRPEAVRKLKCATS